jgi:hypothetical protein
LPAPRVPPRDRGGEALGEIGRRLRGRGRAEFESARTDGDADQIACRQSTERVGSEQPGGLRHRVHRDTARLQERVVDGDENLGHRRAIAQPLVARLVAEQREGMQVCARLEGRVRNLGAGEPVSR